MFGIDSQEISSRCEVETGIEMTEEVGCSQKDAEIYVASSEALLFSKGTEHGHRGWVGKKVAISGVPKYF